MTPLRTESNIKQHMLDVKLMKRRRGAKTQLSRSIRGTDGRLTVKPENKAGTFRFVMMHVFLKEYLEFYFKRG
jgi:hypothetical protein